MYGSACGCIGSIGRVDVLDEWMYWMYWTSGCIGRDQRMSRLIHQSVMVYGVSCHTSVCGVWVSHVISLSIHI